MSNVIEHQAEQDAITGREITTEQAQAYLDRRGAGCPVCGDSAIEGGSYDLDTGTIYQRMNCTECGADWDDAYELHRILDVDAEWIGEASDWLSEAALRLLRDGSKRAMDHRDGLMMIEESLTFAEFTEAEEFISWLEEGNRTFGHNLWQVYAEYRGQL